MSKKNNNFDLNMEIYSIYVCVHKVITTQREILKKHNLNKNYHSQSFHSAKTKSVPNISSFYVYFPQKISYRNKIYRVIHRSSLQPWSSTIAIHLRWRSIASSSSSSSSTVSTFIHRQKTIGNHCVRIAKMSTHVVWWRDHVLSLLLHYFVMSSLVLDISSGGGSRRGEAKNRWRWTESNGGWTAGVLLDHGSEVGCVGVEKRSGCTSGGSRPPTCRLRNTAAFRVNGWISWRGSGGACGGEEGLVVAELRPVVVGVGHLLIMRDIVDKLPFLLCIYGGTSLSTCFYKGVKVFSWLFNWFGFGQKKFIYTNRRRCFWYDFWHVD